MSHATLAELFLRAAAREPDAVALRRLGADDVTYAELGRAARELARGLAALGIAPGDRVALLGRHAARVDARRRRRRGRGRRSTVPIYHTNSPEECRYVLAHSGARAILCEDAAAAREDRAGPRRAARRSST